MVAAVGGHCQMCGRLSKCLQGHHENYLQRPVIFLCPTCHGRLEADKRHSTERALPRLSPRETLVYEAVVIFKTQQDGCAPSVAMLCEASGVSSSSLVSYYLRNIEAAGYIQVLAGKRNIRVSGGNWELKESLTNLRPTARRVYEAVVSFKRKNDGCAPTLREMMVACEIKTTSQVKYHLDRLHTERLIDYVPGARNIRVVDGHWSLKTYQERGTVQ